MSERDERKIDPNRAPCPAGYPWCERDEIVAAVRAMKEAHRALVREGKQPDPRELEYLAWIVETDTVEPKILCRDDPLFFWEWVQLQKPTPQINSDDDIPF